MAQLHGRIRGLPHHRLNERAGFRLLVGAVLLLSTTAARAQTPASTTVGAAELGALAARLGSDDPAARAVAYGELRALDEDALPGIEARVESLGGHRPPTADVSAAIAEVRHGAGSRRADDHLDIGPGVLPALTARHDATMIAVCESVVLWRALEAIGTTAAYRVLADLVALDGVAWEPETHRFVERVGVRLGPMLIAVRNHPNATVRRWSRWAGTELGFDVPGRAIQLPAVAHDSTLLADTLQAYGAVRQMDAMRVLASYVGSEHAQVRDAARTSLTLFGRNAIWAMREQLELVTGQDANPEWGWERTMNALYAAHDDARLAPVRAELAAGEAAAARGDFSAMGGHYAAVLLRAPELAQREQMAAGYASLGEQRRGHADLTGAEHAYRRAVFLAPGHPRAASWKSALVAVHADLELARGVADLHAYQRVLDLAPDDVRAREVLDRVSGERASRARAKRHFAAGAAALLLLVAALVLLTYRSTRQSVLESNDAEAPDDSDTSPGSLTAPTA